MPRKRLATTKNGYQTMLWTYLDRRSRLNESYSDIEKLKAARIRYGYKIRVLRKAIIKFEKKEAFMSAVREKIIDFNGIDVRAMNKQVRNKERANTRFCFYKYCIEHGIRGNFIGPWLNMDPVSPIRGRLTFTRSFKKDKVNLNFWHRFSQFMNREN